MIVISDKLRLVRPTEDRYFEALAWYGDRYVLDHSEGLGSEPYGMDTITAMYGYLKEKGELFFIEVFENGTWTAIGDVTLSESTMPIVIGVSKYRGVGIASKVIKALLQHAKRSGYERIELKEIYRYNQPSISLFQSCGFRAFESSDETVRMSIDLKDVKTNTECWFVRHGKSVYVKGDDRNMPLDEKHLGDVERITEYFSEIEIDHVIASTFRRAVDTVSGIANEKRLAVEEIEDLREREVGEYVEDFKAFVQRQWSDFEYASTGGESINQVKGRGVEAFEKVLSRHDGKRIVIGTHGTILTALLNHYDPGVGYEFWSQLEMPDMVRVEFCESSIASIDIGVWKGASRRGQESGS
ncbi:MULTISPECIES: GNAT family N-acetyltransferase [unclassified Fusibacter]|uniref:GNAT family N-acetyltransferase n=1 Tax=unclassified Fusibacter TaxID=2624464 RepID=UPI00101374A8|nr:MULTISPECIES: GNAT family N-acetyltransferase [unclassified Fusibacter]MCK8059593.1 GNAT family N-acetyltransferase [Fusibacter sp. A2]NPE21394.1 GNAT family N-acetyltransferase [Fusibacter sp. A1]RXV61809.1 GNAT family N-acetyltransferase [Fusibacter sp. A1]